MLEFRLEEKMKFCKEYQNHMNEQPNKVPKIGYKRLKHSLKQCRTHIQSQPENKPECTKCDEKFFGSLLDEMSAVAECFNKQAKKLLHPPLLKGIWKYYCVGCNGNGFEKGDAPLVKKGENLLIYAMFNAIAFRKILKKYDKVHNCEKGQAFRRGEQVKHKEILHSPWFCELMAFHMNLRDRKLKSGSGEANAFFEGLVLAFSAEEKPSMTCELFRSTRVDVDLTCSICLVSQNAMAISSFIKQPFLGWSALTTMNSKKQDTVFDAVALKCGHILCYMCACSAASVTIVDGLKMAEPHKKCPLCRQNGVYGGAIHLEELNILLSRRCPDYWRKRLETERVERLRLVKEHWQSQCRAFVGV
ncbi:hypothetical protein Cgig2_009558 [Carnegiea gigantea]|uniref:RING-type E3 ubiquitin transferase n=1 Tax=Carnegiea gigantea TaxID=171969 RepID=A0A9Q1KB63_9CARY|nr:hypothetical protein Cgig2_009558 [Carnegiea gigantea]